MGEFLVSKKGIGYLINYGSQVFNLDLVIAGIIILMIVSYLMYLAVLYIEKMLIKEWRKSALIMGADLYFFGFFSCFNIYFWHNNIHIKFSI